MRVLVCGSSGCVGRAVVSALRARGHQVVEGARGVPVTRHSLPIDYAQSVAPAEWADRLRAHQIEAVVNCVGILMPSRGQSFERIHANGPTELFRGAALGVGDSPEALATPYLHSKLQADDALAATSLEWAVLRPSLVYGPHSQSAALFATLASLPVISLPGLGGQQVQPIHVFELAETVARLIEQTDAPRAVFELGGEQALSYRDMLAHYRRALGLPAARWLPVPLTLMKLGAWAAEFLPQKVFCRDTIALLDRGSVPAHNHAPQLLGRAPCNLAHGLAVTAPEPMLDLRVQLSPLVQGTLRAALAFMWIFTAVITLLLPEASGVMNLLARCGLEGRAAQIAMLFSCTLNLGIGVWTLWRPAPLVFAVQLAAVIGYTATAAFNMPELTIDHCGPLVKNLPVLGLVAVLWLAVPAGSRGTPRAASARRQLGAVSMV